MLNSIHCPRDRYEDGWLPALRRLLAEISMPRAPRSPFPCKCKPKSTPNLRKNSRNTLSVLCKRRQELPHKVSRRCWTGNWGAWSASLASAGEYDALK
ncbi:hypothetical protein BOTBODRAFT_389866 [Botryobasidium botryosum FD-172 SS1]|uniref:Uncharacterized protein n=1 Tax=Botryobasidium botryosum (strain FD-172 SS1) TaxID=930990 RepID=A0A067N7T3_BOTB1|nr:hypothetical protein BOTBODRAFT_389866 [Botryobasidium botryosum FD-172 SS1]